MAKEAEAANGSSDNGKNKRIKTPNWVYFALIAFAIISYVALPVPLQPHHGEVPSIQHVFYYGWLTAISTGLGALPLVFAPNLASYWVGISNGKMIDDE
jgi:ZIP family zinc transporter